MHIREGIWYLAYSVSIVIENTQKVKENGASCNMIVAFSPCWYFCGALIFLLYTCGYYD